MAENAITAAILPQNHRFGVIQDLLKRQRPQAAKMVMPGQFIPQDGGTGNAAEKPGEGAQRNCNAEYAGR